MKQTPLVQAKKVDLQALTVGPFLLKNKAFYKLEQDFF